MTTPYYSQPPRDVLSQVLTTLQSLSEQVGQMRETMATREDLAKVVQLDVYQVEQRAALERIADHAARITAVESKVDALRDKMHAAEVADAQQFGQLRYGTQQQIGQVHASAQRGQLAAVIRNNQALVTLLAAVGGALVSAFLSGHIHIS